MSPENVAVDTRYDRLKEFFGDSARVGRPAMRRLDPRVAIVLHPVTHISCVVLLHGEEPEDCEGLEEAIAEAMEGVELLLIAIAPEPPVEVEWCVLAPELPRDSLRARRLVQTLPADQVAIGDDVFNFAPRRLAQRQPLSEAQFDSLSASFFPEREIVRIRIASDEGRLQRIVRRTQLAEEQRQAAWGLGHETIAVRGGPGSGKTLALAARAGWLAETLPGSKIALLAFNRSLLEPLHRCLESVGSAATSAVEVITFADWIRRHELVLDLADLVDADARAAKILPSWAPLLYYDAVLVDEAQDLGDCLLHLVARTIKPRRGGLAIAYDPAQNIRDRPEIRLGGLPQPLLLVDLDVAYRSTSTIAAFCDSLRRGAVPDSSKDAPSSDEEPVRIVWTEGESGFSEFVRFESRRLMQTLGMSPSEFLVVACDSAVRRRLERELAPGPDDDTATSLRVVSPEVAKGHEASCAIVAGWDRMLPGKLSDDRLIVACSRAADLLYLLYDAPDGPRRFEAVPPSIKLFQTWPDDFQGV
jgi:hypothetical protein